MYNPFLSFLLGDLNTTDSVLFAMLSDNGTFYFSDNMTLNDIWPGTM